MPQSEELTFDRPIRFLSRVTLDELLENPILAAQNSATTHSVLNVTRLQFTNTGAVTVTNFTNGQEGQELLILGDGFTTLDHGTNIFTNTGADKLLEADVVYHLVLYGGVWYEIAGSGTAITEGAGIDITSGVVTNLYVGKSVTLYASEVTSTTGGPHPFPNNVRKAVAVVDTTGMGQYRISVTGSSAGGTGNIVPQLSYSTNGSSWTNDTALSTMSNFPSATGTFVSSWATLPAGAKGATMYIAFRTETAFENVVVNTVTIEFKP